MSDFNVEEAVGWQLLRAGQEAVKNAPDVSGATEMRVEVIVRLWTDTWPGSHESGRHKSTVIGDASCIYVNREVSR